MKDLRSVFLVLFVCLGGLLNAAAEQNTELMHALNAMIEKRELDALVSDGTRELVKQLEHHQLETMYWRCLKYREVLKKFESLSAAPEQYLSFWEIEKCVSEYANKKQCAYPEALQKIKLREQQELAKKNNPDRQKSFTLLQLLHDRCLMSSMTSIRDAVGALPEKSQEAERAYVLEQKTKIQAVCEMLQKIENEIWKFQTEPPVGYVRKDVLRKIS